MKNVGIKLTSLMSLLLAGHQYSFTSAAFETYMCAYTHTHIALHLTIKNSEIMPFSTICMDLEIIIVNEASQKEKNKYHMIPRLCEI